MCACVAESHDVIKLMLQFLRENNLTSSLHALQAESGISLNTVQNVDAFSADVMAGRWDVVLGQVSSLYLSQEKLSLLYEQVVLELVEAREMELVREVRVMLSFGSDVISFHLL
jgi:WD40 repeat-containing protein SMU1